MSALRESTEGFTLDARGEDTGATVLLLHGFTGSPWEVRILAEALAARGFDVVAPRLPGHGRTPSEMFEYGFRDWVQASVDALQAIDPNRPVFGAGLSMGALLVTHLAARFERRVQGLALLAPIVEFAAFDARTLKRLRFLPLVELSGYWVPKTSSDLEDDEARAQNPILSKFPLARLRDLWRVQDLAAAAAPKIRVPTLVIGARHDHVARLSGVERFAQRIPGAELMILERGYHIIPRDTERALANSKVCAFFFDIVSTHAVGAPGAAHSF